LKTIDFIQKSGLLVLYIDAHAENSAFQKIPDLVVEQMGLPGAPPLKAVVIDFKNDPKMAASDWKKVKDHMSMVPGKNKVFVVQLPTSLGAEFQKEAGVVIKATIEEVFGDLTTQRTNNAAARPGVGGAPGKSAVKSPADAAMEKLFIETFQKCFLHTMKVQCSTDFTVKAPFVKTPTNKPNHDIASTMGMMSKTISGSIALGFSEKAFLDILGRMLGEKYTEINKEVEDGCGELLNIIFGQAKGVFAEHGHQFGKTLPSIFLGHSLRVRQLTPNPSFVLPFESSIGTVYLELGYRKV
jgi:CheY-specific phosphatase CheX